MDWNELKKKKLTKWIISIIASCIVIFLALQNISTLSKAVAWCIRLVMPLLLGTMIAMILNVPMSFFERKYWPKAKRPFFRKLRRPLAFLSALLMIVAIIAGVVWLIIPELVEALGLLKDTVISYLDKFESMTPAELEELPFGKQLLSVDWDDLLLTAQNWLADQSKNIISITVGTISSVVGGLFNFFMAMAFSFYILFTKDSLKRQAKRLVNAWVPTKPAAWTLHASRVIGANFRSFVSGQTLEALILGSLCMIGMLILKIPYAPMVGTLVGVSALIPVIGAFAGAGVGAFMILTVEPFKALIFLIFLCVLQWVEGNLIYPKVMGSRINLPGIWVLAGVTVGGSLAGPLGMLLGVPVTASAYVLFREATEKKEQKNARKTVKPEENKAKQKIEN